MLLLFAAGVAGQAIQQAWLRHGYETQMTFNAQEIILKKIIFCVVFCNNSTQNFSNGCKFLLNKATVVNRNSGLRE